MPFDRLPGSVHTLYAELLEQSIHADAAEAAIGAPACRQFRPQEDQGPHLLVPATA